MEIKHRFDIQNVAPAARDATRSKTLSSGLRLLEWMSERREPVGVRDAGRALGMNAALVQRLLNTLADHGFVEQDPETRRYRVGVRALQVGRAYMAGDGLVDIASPVLKALSDNDTLNTYLGVRNGLVCVYLIVHQSQGALSVNVVPGDQVPLHSTAMGKALLADLPDDEVRELLGRSDMRAMTRSTKVDIEAVLREVRLARDGGIALSDQENVQGIFACGAPIRGRDGRIIAAASSACAAHLVNSDMKAKMCGDILVAANTISMRMGAQNVTQ